MARRKKRVIAQTVVDPTLPSASVTIGGKEYRLCFDFGALAEARAHFRRAGLVDFNLLEKLANLDIDGVYFVFPCAVHKFHPDLTFEQAQKLLTIPAAYSVLQGIGEAWNESVPVPKEAKEAPGENPPQA